ncbi:hypothetical protein BDP27DRAFT_1325146 [Rhodocollybia butyracea]|uniref:Uncharacterized protein n=1 Tax=Rhodocollybia butyracea TaxID=206335 RepID=A0A9P5PX40_9AGAR|nr:hypothetical protein BDP27DRAFT_1325146 [Rhodocollybia butyracea]
MGRERKVRAERRALVMGGGGEGEERENENDTESDASLNGLSLHPKHPKHTWGSGSGDEEDDDVEGMPLRPMKRLRIDGDSGLPFEFGVEANDKDGAGEERENQAEGIERPSDLFISNLSANMNTNQKRVKWHQGLYQEICLDDIKPRTTHARITQESIKKGCLAPGAKALRLDTLGNLPNADSPLKHLVQENVVVKKFVYDSDVVVDEVPPPAPIPKKVAVKPVRTRSKAKAKKNK